MKAKYIISAALLVTLAIFAQGWRTGQQSNNSNPTAQNCANVGCHGGTAPGSNLLLNPISGNNKTWTPGNNALVIQPIAATDTLGGGFSGDSTFKCWGYTMNFTTCTGQPLPISVSLHNCAAGISLRYQSNGIWYVESTGNAPLVWQTISGQPSNVSYLTTYCMVAFTIAGNYTDSLKINIGAVLSDCDSTRLGDSTIFTSSKLGFGGALDADIFGTHHLHPDGMEAPVFWELINAHGVVISTGNGPIKKGLPTGIYYLRKGFKTTKIYIR